MRSLKLFLHRRHCKPWERKSFVSFLTVESNLTPWSRTSALSCMQLGGCMCVGVGGEESQEEAIVGAEQTPGKWFDPILGNITLPR